MIIDFTFDTAKSLFSIGEVFAIRKSTKGMTPDEIFTWLNMRSDETGNDLFSQLANSMIVKL